MNKILTKITGAVLGLSMAVGVGTAVAVNAKEPSRVEASSTANWAANNMGLGNSEVTGTGSYDFDDDTNITISFTNGGTNTAYYTDGGVRIYNGGTFTIASSDGNITGITLTYTLNSGATISASPAGGFTSGGTTWSGNSSNVVFTAGTKKHVRLASLIVTYSSSGSSTVDITRAISGPANLNKSTSDTSFDISGDITIQDESPATGYTVSSSDSAIVSVSGTTLTPVAEGSATITISKPSSSSESGGITTNITYTSHTFTVTVSAPEPADAVQYSKRYSADTDINGVEIDKTDFTVTMNKGTGGNNPKYFTSGTAVRAYAGNTIVVSSSTKKITSITLTFGSGDGSNTITSSPDGFTSPTWTGEAIEVTFTIGGSSGNRRISAVQVTTQTVTPEITDFSISPTSCDLGVGKTTTITASVTGIGAFDDSVSWEITSGGSFASIVSSADTQCTVRGDAAGTAVLTATDADGDDLTCTITVKALQNVTATINFANENEIIGEKGSEITTWGKDEARYVVEKNESTTGVGNGTYYSNPLRIYSKQLVTISAGGYEIVSVTITASSAANASNIASATWTGATATSSGSTVSVAPTSGATTLTYCNSSSRTDTSSIDIVYYGPAPSSIALNSITLSESATGIAQGDSKTLTVATFDPSNATNKDVVWSSEDTSIATVDASSGKVTVANNATVGDTVDIICTPDDTHASAVSCTVTVLTAVIKKVDMNVGLNNSKDNRLELTTSQGLSSWPAGAIVVTYTNTQTLTLSYNTSGVVWYYNNSDDTNNDVEINDISSFTFETTMKRMRLSYNGVLAGRTYITVSEPVAGIIDGTYDGVNSFYLDDEGYVTLQCPTGYTYFGYSSDSEGIFTTYTTGVIRSSGTVKVPYWTADSTASNDTLTVWFYAQENNPSQSTSININININNPTGLAAARSYAALLQESCDAGTHADDWSTLASSYNELSSEAKAYLHDALYTLNGVNVIKDPTTHKEVAIGAEIYDRCVSVHGLSNFMNRTVVPHTGISTTSNGLFANVGSEATVSIIVVISVISLTTIGAFVFVRRRKEN
ncbi:MAG: Ig-like domain-containing protein [Bacilli bacterium]|nr:Ig-like domain-containing protein [Bacilli bacterium]